MIRLTNRRRARRSRRRATHRRRVHLILLAHHEASTPIGVDQRNLRFVERKNDFMVSIVFRASGKNCILTKV
jgi:hypothetical protein